MPVKSLIMIRNKRNKRFYKKILKNSRKDKLTKRKTSNRMKTDKNFYKHIVEHKLVLSGYALSALSEKLFQTLLERTRSKNKKKNLKDIYISM